MYKDFKDLKNNVKTSEKTIVVAAAHETHTLEAVSSAVKELGIKYLLVGDRNKIISLSSEIGFTPDNDCIIDSSNDDECAAKAIGLIREGSGNALMKGIVETGILLKAVLDKNHGIRDSKTLSHMALLEVPGYHKLIGITDGGMIPNPVFDQKIDIVKNAVSFFHRIRYKCPKVAVLCASESVNPKIPETVDASKLQELNINREFGESGEFGKCILEGPLSFDIAINKVSAETKGFKSKISGDTDILIVPNITVGNVLAKGLIYWANAKMAGCILGAKTPIILTSRGASTEEKHLSILLSLI